MATRKRYSKKIPPVDSNYKPHYQPAAQKRSPYPTRPAEGKTGQESGTEAEVSGDEGQERCSDLERGTVVEEEFSEGEGMARKRKES